MRQCIITKFIVKFDRELYLEKYYRRILLTSCIRILFNKQSYSVQYALFGITYNFWQDESDYCSNITGLGFTLEPSPDHTERFPQNWNI